MYIMYLSIHLFLDISITNYSIMNVFAYQTLFFFSWFRIIISLGYILKNRYTKRHKKI